MTDNDSLQSLRADKIGAAIAEYLLAFDSGEPLAKEAWLDRYPDLRTELGAFLQADSDWESLIATPASTRDGDGNTLHSRSGAATVDTVEIAIEGYQVLEELGHGGMGSVYRARQISLDRMVALKIPHGLHLSGEERRRFEREADAVAKLDHPHVVPIFDVGKSLKQPFLAMKLLTGGSLRQLGKLEPQRAAKLMISISEAIEHAHQRGILHRDLKPSNVMLDDQGQPIVTDFGLAKQLDREVFAGDETTVGAMLGTPAYMAPEQVAGEATTLSDVYSLGAILYSLLTGITPFTGTSPIDIIGKVRNEDPVVPRKLDNKIPSDLETICLKCLNKDPRKRYESAKELRRDLDAWLNDMPILAKPASPFDRLLLWTRRNPALALSLGVTAAALVTAVTAMGWMLIRAERDNRLLQAERSVAVENLQLAEQAIDELLSEVQDELVHFPAIDKVRNRMLQHALDLQQKLMIHNDVKLVSLVEHPTARLRLAELYWELGQVTEASRELEKVQAVVKRLDDSKDEVNHSDFNLALRCRTSKLQAEIHQHHQQFQEAEDTLSNLVELRAKEKDRQWALSHEYAYLAARRQRAILIAKHSQDESFVEFEKVLRETEAIQGRAETGALSEQRRARELLANATNSYGIALKADGQMEAAIKSYQRTVEILQELGEREPLNHPQKSSLAGTLLNLGNIFIQRSSYQDAAQSYLDSMNLYKELAIENPSRSLNKERIIGTLVGLGIASYRANRVEQAIELYQEAQELLKKFDREHPELKDAWNRQHSTILLNLVNCYNETEQFEKAHEIADQVISMRRLENSADPDGGRGASGLALAIGNKAAIYEKQNRPEEVLQLLAEVMECHEAALVYAPRSTEFLQRYENDVRRLLRIYLGDASYGSMRQLLEKFRQRTKSDPAMLGQMLEFARSQAEANSEEAQAVLASFQ